MTYAYMVGEFNAGYKWDDQIGLVLQADPSLEIMLPEPYTISFEFSKDDFPNEGLSDDMATITAVEDYYMLRVISGLHPEMHDYVIKSQINYLDGAGSYICTETKEFGTLYDGYKKSNFPVYENGIIIPLFAKRVEVNVTFEPLAYALAKASDASVEVEYYTDQMISLERLESHGGVYIEGFNIDYTKPNYPLALLEHDMIHAYSGRTVKGSESKFQVVVGGNGDPVFIDHTSKYKLLSALTNLYIDGLETLNRLTGKKDDSVLFTIKDQGIRLYDKDKKLIKIYISQKRIVELYK